MADTQIAEKPAKEKKVLTPEEKEKLAAERKQKDTERLAGATALFSTAAKIKNIDAKRIVLGSSKYKVTPGELSDMLTAGTITPEDEALIREFKLVKTYTTKSSADTVPYNWPSFSDYTEGESGDKELEAKLVEFSGNVDKFYEANDALLSDIEELTKKNQVRLNEPAEDSNGAIFMNYFKFTKAKKAKEPDTTNSEALVPQA